MEKRFVVEDGRSGAVVLDRIESSRNPEEVAVWVSDTEVGESIAERLNEGEEAPD